jgi:glycosyltransferase involved in cell wall biosynthesis
MDFGRPCDLGKNVYSNRCIYAKRSFVGNVLQLKKVLVISYYWPPSGGPGVQRVLKFCKYLPEFGWEPIVLTVKDGEYPNLDYSLEKEADKLGIRVIKTKTYEPFKFYKWMTGKNSMPSYELNKSKSGLFSKLSKWIRMNYFIPDARKGWIPYGVKAGRELLKNEKIDMIFSSGPPHSLHFIAKKLKEEFSVPWVSDFRDPWTDLFYYDGHERSAIAEKKDAEMEKEILESADGVTTVSDGTKNILTNKGNDININVVHNGYDEDDFCHTAESKIKNSKKIITYVGSMALSQVSEEFFKGISDLIWDNNEDIEIRFIGDVHEKAWELIKSYNLRDKVFHLGYIPHNEVISKLFESDILLLVIPNTKESKLIITGKLYEYLRSGIPILALADLDGDAAKILNDTKSGIVVSHDDAEGIKDIILQKEYELSQNIEQFSRKELTHLLTEIFNRVQ